MQLHLLGDTEHVFDHVCWDGAIAAAVNRCAAARGHRRLGHDGAANEIARLGLPPQARRRPRRRVGAR